MRLIKVMAVLLVLSLVFAGCSMIEVNEEKDRQTVVAKVGSQTVLKGDVVDAIENQLQIYMMYGYYPEDFATNPEYSEYYTEFVTGIVDAMVGNEVEKTIAREKGCYDFSAEDRAAIDDDISSTLNIYAEMYATDLAELPENALLSEEELNALAFENLDAYLLEKDFGITKEDVIKNAEDTKALEILYNITSSGIEVTEDEVKAAYDADVAAAKLGYEDGSADFESDVSNGTTIYYVPENVRQAQHILIKISDEDLQEIANLKSSEDTVAADLKYKEALKGIEDAANTAYDRAASGDDFALLIDELGEDPGMDSNEYYTVMNPSTKFVEEFVDGLFALENVGDISEPVATSYGYHIIKYYGDMESGPVAYDDLRDEIYDSMLSERKDAYYNEQFALWKEGIDIKTYYDRVLK
ncbi:MAG: peptidylprolyl isomerase [Clostridia bacterium]|nr:peptidylprolyl isomerase [Clostridia bacterium]